MYNFENDMTTLDVTAESRKTAKNGVDVGIRRVDLKSGKSPEIDLLTCTVKFVNHFIILFIQKKLFKELDTSYLEEVIYFNDIVQFWVY